MRSTTRLFLTAALVLGMGSVAYAELQNVSVSGSLRIRGNYFEGDDTVRTPQGEQSYDAAFVEQRTRLGVRADFSENVNAFIELDSYGNWGEDFRSNYMTGVDGRASLQGNTAEVEIYQAYVEANEMWGTPLHLRAGRQEISLGSEWLVGVNDTSAFFTGLSFDAVMVSLVTDPVTVHAIWAKLAEGNGDVLEADVDFYTLYASVTALDDMVFDFYWMYLKDETLRAARPFARTPSRDIEIHTVGVRTAGVISGFDWEAELAYQFGSIDVPNRKDLHYGAFAVNTELGYTFDISLQPRPFIGFAYFGDEDGGDDSDMAFNRMFSNWEYSEFLENTAMSDVWISRVGFCLSPIEQITLKAVGTCFVGEPRHRHDPWDENDVTAVELGLYADYNYSEDLVFRAGYAHLWAGDKLRTDRITANGLRRFGNRQDEHLDYVYLETEISF